MHHTFYTAATFHQLVEYMEAPLCFAADYDSALLQQVPIDVSSRNAAIGGKADSDELSEATRVVVPLGLCITKRLEDWIGLQDLALE